MSTTTKVLDAAMFSVGTVVSTEASFGTVTTCVTCAAGELQLRKNVPSHCAVTSDGARSFSVVVQTRKGFATPATKYHCTPDRAMAYLPLHKPLKTCGMLP